MKSELPPPTLRLRLDGEALATNWRTLDGLSGSAEAGAAVKADGYGLGVDGVVPVLREAGARTFFVAHWSEVSAVLRHVAGLLSWLTLNLGHALALLPPDKRALHDYIAGTRVVRDARGARMPGWVAAWITLQVVAAVALVAWLLLRYVAALQAGIPGL